MSIVRARKQCCTICTDLYRVRHLACMAPLTVMVTVAFKARVACLACGGDAPSRLYVCVCVYLQYKCICVSIFPDRCVTWHSELHVSASAHHPSQLVAHTCTPRRSTWTMLWMYAVSTLESPMKDAQVQTMAVSTCLRPAGLRWCLCKRWVRPYACVVRACRARTCQYICTVRWQGCRLSRRRIKMASFAPDPPD